jgi:trimeric autotransporter adhesin
MTILQVMLTTLSALEQGNRNTTGNFNNSFGTGAGCENTTGRYNNFIGSYAGRTSTIGSNNTIIGNRADIATDSLSGVIVLGTGAVATESHQIVLSTANVSFKSTGNIFEIGSPSLSSNLTVYGNITATQTVHALSNVVFTNLPTVSSSSAQQGTLWIDGGVLKVMGY